MNVRINPHGMPDTQRLYGLAELALFLGGSEDSWTGDFLRLVAKSDPEHFDALRVAAPVLVQAWTLWHTMPDPTVADLTDALVRHGIVDADACGHRWSVSYGEHKSVTASCDQRGEHAIHDGPVTVDDPFGVLGHARLRWSS